jgi:hypothetical protein
MIMAKEGRVRKPHRRDWPSFLTLLVPAQVWRALGRTIAARDDPRVRWTLRYVLLAYVGMAWSRQSCLNERFREAWEWIAGLFRHRRRPGRTYVGLTKASQQVGPGLFQQFWACLRETVPGRVGKGWVWHGWQVFAVDGSREDAPRTRANERGLGRSGRDKTHPQWWMTWLVHLPTLMLWDWRQGPGSSSERQHMRQMLGSLPPSALLVGDIGFGGFDFLWDLIQGGVHFLIRCGSNTTLLVEGAVCRVQKTGDHRWVYLWPTGRRRQTPLKLRLITLKRRGKRVCLLTNVPEPVRLSRSMARDFYEARWGIEVNYRGFKQTMERCKVLARTPQRGALELAGSVVAMGLLRLHAAIVMGAQMVRMSVAATLRVIRKAMEAVRFGQSTCWIVVELRTAVKDTYQRRRCKRARDWPHKKNESPPGPPRMRRLTTAERTRIEAKIHEHLAQDS